MRIKPVIIVCAVLLAAALIAWAIDDGQAVSLPAIDVDGTRYGSIGPLLGLPGVEHQWNPDTQRLVVQTDRSIVTLTAMTPLVIVNGQVEQLGQAPRFVDGRLALPQEFYDRVAGPALGITVEWITGTEPDRPARASLAHPFVVRRIAVDPGHGGKDYGAMSPGGILEKDITLAVALRLARLLEEEAGIDVVLTRSDDRFVALSKRTQIANDAQADLFVSIHANAYRGRESTGVETYYLNFDPSDEKAREMALAENEAIGFEEVGGLSGGAGEDAFDDLKVILWDLVKTEHLAESARLAELVQRKMTEATGSRNRGVRQAPLFVLMGADMPAILSEIGFLSNPEEARRLASPPVQDRLAHALYEALLRYDATLAGARRPVQTRPAHLSREAQ